MTPDAGQNGGIPNCCCHSNDVVVVVCLRAAAAARPTDGCCAGGDVQPLYRTLNVGDGDLSKWIPRFNWNLFCFLSESFHVFFYFLVGEPNGDQTPPFFFWILLWDNFIYLFIFLLMKTRSDIAFSNDLRTLHFSFFSHLPTFAENTQSLSGYLKEGWKKKKRSSPGIPSFNWTTRKYLSTILPFRFFCCFSRPVSLTLSTFSERHIHLFLGMESLTDNWFQILHWTTKQGVKTTYQMSWDVERASSV